MWKANGETTTLQLFLDSLSPKNMQDASSGVKLKIALFGELSLEEAMDLSQDRQIFLYSVDGYHCFRGTNFLHLHDLNHHIPAIYLFISMYIP
jgi:hypothetical protein